MHSDAGAFPDSVGRKQRGDLFGIMIVVADRAVASLEFLDRLDVLENRDSLFELANIHRFKPPRVLPAALELRDARVKWRAQTSAQEIATASNHLRGGR
jgi:hypothetical protein